MNSKHECQLKDLGGHSQKANQPCNYQNNPYLSFSASAPAPQPALLTPISPPLSVTSPRTSSAIRSKTLQRGWGKQGTEKFQDHHPLHACNEHNFLYHLTPLPSGQIRPPGLENPPRIHLIDSGRTTTAQPTSSCTPHAPST
jgi:hypothetical protein